MRVLGAEAGERPRLRPGRVAPDRVDVAAVQAARAQGDAAVVVELRRIPACVGDRRRGGGQVVVGKRAHEEPLADPALRVVSARRQRRVVREQLTVALRMRDVDRERLVPDVVLEAVERGRAPVARRGRRLDLEHGRRPARELNAPVLAAPDVGDTDLAPGRVRVPALPFDDAARGDGRRRRGRDRCEHEQHAGGERRAQRRPRAQRAEQEQAPGEQQHAAGERARAAEQRRRPRRARREHDAGRDGPPCGDRHGEPEREDEDGEENERVHLRGAGVGRTAR